MLYINYKYSVFTTLIVYISAYWHVRKIVGGNALHVLEIVVNKFIMGNREIFLWVSKIIISTYFGGFLVPIWEMRQKYTVSTLTRSSTFYYCFRSLALRQLLIHNQRWARAYIFPQGTETITSTKVLPVANIIDFPVFFMGTTNSQQIVRLYSWVYDLDMKRTGLLIAFSTLDGMYFLCSHSPYLCGIGISHSCQCDLTHILQVPDPGGRIEN